MFIIKKTEKDTLISFLIRKHKPGVTSVLVGKAYLPSLCSWSGALV